MIRSLVVLTLLFTAAGCRSQTEAPVAQETTKAPAQAAPAPSPADFVPNVQPLKSAPEAFGAVPVPEDNPQTPEKVALGHQLFFDTRLSGDGSRSCYSCHVNEKGLTDGLPKAVGAFEKQLTRSSPTMWNVGWHPSFYWDGRAPSLEKQAMGAWTGGNMGADADKVVERLNAIPGYRAQFEKVFGSPATPELVTKALSAYERTIVCADTAWDRKQAGDESAMTEEQKRGEKVFYAAACAACHTPPHFTDRRFHNVGIGLDTENPDLGRGKVSGNESETGAFTTPTLRDVTRSAPYFHDGSSATLEEAVDVMLSGGKKNPHLDPILRDVQISEQERSDLLAFLGALSCEHIALTAPELPPEPTQAAAQ